MRLILASASPRRADLLRAAGYDFDVVAADVDESARPGEAPQEYVRRVAADKARAVLARFPEAVVVGADTTVVVDGEMMGKPADDAESCRMLARLSGRAHRVLTGVVVARAGRAVCEVVSTQVRFATLTGEDIERYVASGEPGDKAGAYAVQGLAARFVEAIEGSYSNVVGLPLPALGRLLAAQGVPPSTHGPGDRLDNPPEAIDRA